jgi:hypothetical protein
MRTIGFGHVLHRKIPVLVSSVRFIAQRIADTRLELNQPQYKDVNLEFRRKQVELKTLEMGNKDLERYCKGLEKALLAYHSTKMESINQVFSLFLLASHCRPNLKRLTSVLKNFGNCACAIRLWGRMDAVAEGALAEDI